MAHTIKKHMYSEKDKSYIICEILVLDEEEMLAGNDRREIVLECQKKGNEYLNIGPDTLDLGLDDIEYPETELLNQYENFEKD